MQDELAFMLETWRDADERAARAWLLAASEGGELAWLDQLPIEDRSSRTVKRGDAPLHNPSRD